MGLLGSLEASDLLPQEQISNQNEFKYPCYGNRTEKNEDLKGHNNLE